jgi:very-short-patch-repair endonuclease
LPPTSFFLSFTGSFFDADESEVSSEAELSDEEIAEKALEKQILNSKDLLTVCEPLLRSSYLDMHYRSEHPSLIEFSNHAFYGGRLQCPPATATDDGTPAIEYRELTGTYENNQNRDEARAVIDLLRQIWKDEPCPTVGVVTFNAKQQDLIENLIQEEAIRDSDFRLRFESESAREEGEQQVGFFVKNLESVQGDEREVMIFSTTFGRDSAGEFKRFFGPINLEGGEKRLNVAVTRAKKKIYILTSMPVFEISDAFVSRDAFEGKRVTGREYLQGYLLYARAVSERDAKRAQEILGRARELGFSRDSEGRRTTIAFDSEFEIAVYEALRHKGVALDTQVGVAGFRVDLAVKHLDPTKGYLMGIECDGKTFHSSFSARARDIWREQILRSRGWRVHRIWSSDWWANPEFEVQKVLEAIQRYSGGQPRLPL